MKIQSMSSQNQNHNTFGHTFKVSICVRNSAKENYRFINPVNDTDLYKQLNSKFVGWLNENFITSLRRKLNKPRLRQRHLSARDLEGKKQITEALTQIDTDYRALGIARSIYNDKG